MICGYKKIQHWIKNCSSAKSVELLLAAVSSSMQLYSRCVATLHRILLVMCKRLWYSIPNGLRRHGTRVGFSAHWITKIKRKNFEVASQQLAAMPTMQTRRLPPHFDSWIIKAGPPTPYRSTMRQLCTNRTYTNTLRWNIFGVTMFSPRLVQGGSVKWHFAKALHQFCTAKCQVDY